LALVGTVVAGTVWLILYRLGIEGSGLKVVIAARSYRYHHQVNLATSCV
jgi:hypothetical protein